MRKFSLLTSVCVVLCIGWAHAQDIAEIDVAASGSTLFSAKPTTASLSNRPPAEDGGVYTGLNADVLLRNHFGLQADFAFRYHRGPYQEYQLSRPILYDINGMYSNKLTKKTRLDLFAGVGGQSTLFFNPASTCPTDVCRTSISANHFLVHVGGGVRYYLWHHLFIRPEANFYRVINNNEFSSDNVFRAGASIGYAFAY